MPLFILSLSLSRTASEWKDDGDQAFNVVCVKN